MPWYTLTRSSTCNTVRKQLFFDGIFFYRHPCERSSSRVIAAHYLYGNTAQYACGIFRKNRALILSLFLAIHNTTRFARMHKFA